MALSEKQLDLAALEPWRRMLPARSAAHSTHPGSRTTSFGEAAAPVLPPAES
jgi:hypothetical protein